MPDKFIAPKFYEIEDELALFDILTRPNIKLSRAKRKPVKEVVQELLDTLKTECPSL